ncbi:hypothetical protein [Flavobacterium tibetense]|uniref:Uncharacterized protein n=1 Tax=Flavobacterium tibetense TaxID=2233533 RepID=A0A365NYK1_9FLAO|nr:hypothetical protein [Flavobacterium tibetense]RBA27318.1 hypothetical protein DPN68_12790 [Flavobacterium tibetense]
MKKLLLFLFLITSIFSFSQEKKKEEIQKNVSKTKTVKNNNQLSVTPLPVESKISPEVFYIIKDKPVSKEVYMQYLFDQQRNK